MRTPNHFMYHYFQQSKISGCHLMLYLGRVNILYLNLLLTNMVKNNSFMKSQECRYTYFRGSIDEVYHAFAVNSFDIGESFSKLEYHVLCTIYQCQISSMCCMPFEITTADKVLNQFIRLHVLMQILGLVRKCLNFSSSVQNLTF